MNSTENIEEQKSKATPKAPKIDALVAQCETLILATVDADGKPNSSYAPFVHLDGSFQILVSFMARHTKNLRDQKKVSFMLIEDEATSKQIYARHRLTLESEAELIETGSDLWTRALDQMKIKHGKVVDVISSMDDFIMFDLKPLSGSYVNGFGSAYFVGADLQVQDHRKGNHGNPHLATDPS